MLLHLSWNSQFQKPWILLNFHQNVSLKLLEIRPADLLDTLTLRPTDSQQHSSHLTLCRISRTNWKLTFSDEPFFLTFSFISNAGPLELDSMLRRLRNYHFTIIILLLLCADVPLKTAHPLCRSKMFACFVGVPALRASCHISKNKLATCFSQYSCTDFYANIEIC